MISAVRFSRAPSARVVPRRLMGGAFGSYTHSGESAQMIFDTMENVYKMDMVDLGALNLKEHVVNTEEGLRACQDYGKAVGQKLA